jgi:hypothetical protein
MKSEQFKYHGSPIRADRNPLCLWPEGMYLTRICRYEADIEGRPITSFRSCTDTDQNLDKAAFFVFLDDNRLIYYSSEPAFAFRNFVRNSNDPTLVNRDLLDNNNKNKNMMRGYYIIEKNKKTPESLLIRTHFERANAKQVFIDLDYNIASKQISIVRVGRRDDEGFKSTQTTPMFEWDSVFAQRLDFSCVTKDLPTLTAGGNKDIKTATLPW